MCSTLKIGIADLQKKLAQKIFKRVASILWLQLFPPVSLVFSFFVNDFESAFVSFTIIQMFTMAGAHGNETNLCKATALNM